MDNSLVDWDGEFIRRFAAMAKRPEEEVERVVRNRQKFEIEEGSDVPSAREVSSIYAELCVCTSLFIFNILYNIYFLKELKIKWALFWSLYPPYYWSKLTRSKGH